MPGFYFLLNILYLYIIYIVLYNTLYYTQGISYYFIKGVFP